MCGSEKAWPPAFPREEKWEEGGAEMSNMLCICVDEWVSVPAFDWSGPPPPRAEDPWALLSNEVGVCVERSFDVGGGALIFTRDIASSSVRSTALWREKASGRASDGNAEFDEEWAVLLGPLAF